MKTAASLARRGQAPQSDADLMRLLAAGDLGALGELYDRHHEAVHQFARRACPQAADVDDVVHDTFLTASRAAASYDGRDSARPFLVGIAAQLVRQRRRLWARWTEVLHSFVSARSDETSRTPEDLAHDAEAGERLDRALAGLTEEKRLVLLLFEREGLSGEEVARALDIPLGTVWTRLHHARAELRRALQSVKMGEAPKPPGKAMSARLLRVEPAAPEAPAEPCAMACLVEAGRDGRLGEREEASLARHLATCGPCRVLARDLDEVRTLLRRPTGSPISTLDHQRGRLSLLRTASAPPGPDSSATGSAPPRWRRRSRLAVTLVTLAALASAVVALAAPVLPGRRSAAVPVAQRLPALHVARAALAAADAVTLGTSPPNPGTLGTSPPNPVDPRETTVRSTLPEVERVTLAHVTPGPRAAPANPSPAHVAASTAAGEAKGGSSPRAPAEPAPADEGGASRSFARAVDLIARGDYAAAGTELQAFNAAHPGDGRADLAAFLTIVSLQRAGRRGEAQEAARRYLDLYPEGDRRADVLRVANGR